LIVVSSLIIGPPKERGPNSKAASSWIKTSGFAFLPANADFREGIIGAVGTGGENPGKTR
jgi:hypothetical protein